MMSIFGVTILDVIENLPIDASQITATTAPISTVSLESWILEGEDDLTSVLRRAGHDPSSVSDEIRGQMRKAVRAYATAQALKAYGLVGAQYQDYLGEYQRLYERFQEDPTTISGTTVTTRTGKASQSVTRRDYMRKDYKW
jgi:hypothetical protein